MSWNDAQCDACSNEWDIHLLMGCVHEHSGHVRLCAAHRGRLNGGLICVPCINDHPCCVSVVDVLTDRAAVSS